MFIFKKKLQIDIAFEQTKQKSKKLLTYSN